jgi:putative two-component system response regulator
MAVADVYDATRSKRCYKGPMTEAQSCEYLSKQRGYQFDPVVIDAFFKEEHQIDQIGLEMGYAV